MSGRARSFHAAWDGLLHAARSQPNFRIELGVGVAALLGAGWLGAPLAPIALACALVLSLELVNTAVEAAVDLAAPDVHDGARIAKDCAAAAVLVAAIGAVVVGVAVLGPPLLARVVGGGS